MTRLKSILKINDCHKYVAHCCNSHLFWKMFEIWKLLILFILSSEVQWDTHVTCAPNMNTEKQNINTNHCRHHLFARSVFFLCWVWKMDWILISQEFSADVIMELLKIVSVCSVFLLFTADFLQIKFLLVHRIFLFVILSATIVGFNS